MSLKYIFSFRKEGGCLLQRRAVDKMVASHSLSSFYSLRLDPRHRGHLPPPARTPLPSTRFRKTLVQANTTVTRRDAILTATLTLPFTLLDAFPSASQEETSKCELAVAPSGLAFCDTVVGTGSAAAKGQLIKAHYVGKLENGKVFDSSYSRGRPLTFRIGVGEVIKGWDEGILGGDGIPPMLLGGRRTLKIPPELGYGMRGAGCKGGSCIIPPDSSLIFDVEYIGGL